MKANKNDAPSSAFVRDTYNSLLGKLPEGYTAYRWQATPVSRFHFAQSRRALVRALNLIPQRLDRVLEVGGGGGAWTPFFAARAKHIDFLDISEQMLEEAKSALAAYLNISYITGDFTVWEPSDNSYDLLVSIRNIEYMQDKQSVIARIARALHTDGMLLLSTKSPQFDWTGYFSGKTLHSGQIPIRMLLGLLRGNGLSIVAVYPAIMGKKTRYAPIRFAWHLIQRFFLCLPFSLMPISLLAYISESFLVVARKNRI